LNINYTLKPITTDKILEISSDAKFSFIEDYYWKLFEQGNRFFLGKWKFYPMKDEGNIKKTAMNIINMNRNSEEYIYIAEDGDENYIAYSKADSKLHFINMGIEFEESPSLIFDTLEEVINEFSNKSRNYEEHLSRLEEVKKILSENTEIFYLYNTEIDEIAGSLSTEHFPSINFLFWTSEELAESQKYGLWESFEIRKMSMDTFFQITLKRLSSYGDVFAVDWINDSGEEFFAEEFIGEIG